MPERKLGDGPYTLGLFLAQAAFATPSGGLNIIEINNQASTWQFPQALPALVAVCSLVGGQPARVYSTRWILKDRNRNKLAEAPGHDVPFTTQIKRVNLIQGLHQITTAEVVTEPSLFYVALSIDGSEVAEADLEIRKIAKPPSTGTVTQ